MINRGARVRSHHSLLFIILGNMAQLKYSYGELMKLKKGCGYPDPSTIQLLKSIKLFHARGCKSRSRRGGTHAHRPIPSITTPRSPPPSPAPPRHRNLTPIPREPRPTAYPPSLLLTNPTSITNKFDELCLVVRQKDPDMVALSETWFSVNKPAHLYELSDYDLFNKDRNTRGGGVCLYVRKQFSAVKATITVPPHLECLWLHLKNVKQVGQILVCVLYYPPNSDANIHDDLLEHITASVDMFRLRHSNCKVIITGDFNSLDKDQICNQLHIQNLVTQPTHENSVLDLVLTDMQFYRSPEYLPPIGLSKHKCVLVRPTAAPPPPRHHTLQYRPYKESSVREFGSWITAVDWSFLESSPTLEHQENAFHTVLKHQYDTHFPLKTWRKRDSDQPWMTPEIKRLINKKRHAYNQANSERYRELNFCLKRKMKQAKKDYFETVQSESGFNKCITKLIEPKRKPVNLPFLNLDEPCEIANAINEHFATICTNYPPLEPSDVPAHQPSLPPPCYSKLDIYKDLKKIKTNKATPPGEIPLKLVKEFAYELSKPLEIIYNKCLQTGSCPDRWKKSTITALPKVTDVTSLSQLRPVSLTHTFGKMLEGHVASVALADMRPHIDQYQFGNLKGRSTTMYMVFLLDTILKGLEQRDTVAQMCLIDFKKAFDNVDHSVAVTQLYHLGCRTSLLPFITSFLTGRQQCTRYSHATSTWLPTTCGVPQGTCIGPVIFLALINSLLQNSSSKAKFVDDVTVYTVAKTTDLHRNPLQQLITTINNQCQILKLIPNPNKCEMVNISFSRQAVTFPDVQLDANIIPCVDTVKVVGLTINSNLTWQDHVDHIVTQASKRLFMLFRARSFGATQEQLVQLYCQRIRPVLEYACPVWHPALTAAQRTALERVQKRVCRIILGGYYNSYSATLTTFGLPSLEKRRDQLTLSFGEKLKENDHLHILPQRAPSRYRTRHSARLPPVRCRTERYKKSTIPHVVRLFNE